MNRDWTELLLALGRPCCMGEFTPATWSRVVRQASHAGLIGRLGALAERAGVADAIPQPVQRHMTAMRSVATQQRRTVRWELVHLSQSLAALEGPVLMLKGAAYAIADLPPADGRMFSDIDLLVPKAQLDAAEAALMLSGWVSNHHSDYDLRYYRRWMHELPPMAHIKRQTALDLHHDILPATARIKTRPDLILAAGQALAEFPKFSIPAPVDQVLHSATHLFHEGEWEHGLRDLSDLDLLLRAYGPRPEFWPLLTDRTAALGLGRPMFYALSLCRELLVTPVPQQSIDDCPDAPGPLAARAMRFLFLRALTTAHRPSRSRFAELAAFALYLRSHYLRMPPHLLLPHLLAKAWQRFRAGRDSADEANGAVPKA